MYAENKYLIVGLGNPGIEYHNTRHNIGFQIVDKFVSEFNKTFSEARYGNIARIKIKNKQLVLLKPITYMNLSGKAVAFWMKKEKIPASSIFVIYDDVSLPIGQLRIRKKGGAGGHNGMSNIISLTETKDFPRLRFGIGDGFMKSLQSQYVLGKWSEEDLQIISTPIKDACDSIKEMVLSGIESAMNKFNKKNDNRI